jgi:ABC-type dipeptide/oligopeptide/nickel transport system permease subunit
MTAIIAVPLALFLGITAALYRNTYYDKIVSASTLTTISFPEFFVAYILILLLTALWPVFPSLANIDVSTPLGERIYRSALPCPDPHTGNCGTHDAHDAGGDHQPFGLIPIFKWPAYRVQRSAKSS